MCQKHKSSQRTSRRLRVILLVLALLFKNCLCLLRKPFKQYFLPFLSVFFFAFHFFHHFQQCNQQYAKVNLSTFRESILCFSILSPDVSDEVLHWLTCFLVALTFLQLLQFLVVLDVPQLLYSHQFLCEPSS